MNRQGIRVVIALVAVGLFTGIVDAAAPAAVTWLDEFRASAIATSSDTTDGGNITLINLASNTQTERWAGYTGNLSGGLVLSDGTDVFFRWTAGVTEDSVVCAGLNTSYTFDQTLYDAEISYAFSTGWNLTSGSDRGNKTINATEGTFSFTFGGTTFTNLNSSKTGPDEANDHFRTGVINDLSRTDTDTHNFLFCTVVNVTGTHTDYRGSTANYELIVPTYAGSGTVRTTYYFFAEIK
ncbi:MAG: hypothetical protein JXB14_04945 [Candidatus Altiarchaeota archaeon]|nr:hypothetical protein [Candidatus Altiarchaeota archaeon]